MEYIDHLSLWLISKSRWDTLPGPWTSYLELERVLAPAARFIALIRVDLVLERGYRVRIRQPVLPVHLPGRIPDYVPLDDLEFIRAMLRWLAWERL
jgi:hypothetical protein